MFWRKINWRIHSQYWPDLYLIHNGPLKKSSRTRLKLEWTSVITRESNSARWVQSKHMQHAQQTGYHTHLRENKIFWRGKILTVCHDFVKFVITLCRQNNSLYGILRPNIKGIDEQCNKSDTVSVPSASISPCLIQLGQTSKRETGMHIWYSSMLDVWCPCHNVNTCSPAFI